jgi:hypothetical protein
MTMSIELKEEFKTDVSISNPGYLRIRQEGVQVLLSAGQVKTLLKWLEDGNGLSLEADWNNGIDEIDV